MSNKHQMRLNEGPFNKMRSGIKTLELRLHDEKRQKLRIGDKILFLNRDDPYRFFETEIIGLVIYPTFNDLLDNINLKLLGYSNADRERLKVACRDYYPKEEQDRHHVIGIHIKLV